MKNCDTNTYIGIDAGAISVKAVVITENGIDRFACRRTLGRPFQVTLEIIKDIEKKYGPSNNIVTTGSGGRSVAEKINAGHINEFQATSIASRFLYPEIKTILEIGGQTSKYILLDNNGIIDYGINGDCAAGTGSFIDQQAGRLHYKIEDVGEIVLGAPRSARIAGRCSVFAKSDMIHAQQMGYKPNEVLKGLCTAVARNFKASIVKGRKISTPALFIGGVALNKGAIEAITEAFGLPDKDVIVPEMPEYIGAIGSALHAKELHKNRAQSKHRHGKTIHPETNSFHESLSTENVVFLRDVVQEYTLSKDKITPAYMGVDIGSVSTNVVIMDKDGKLIYDIYTSTRARPIEVVAECLKEVHSKFGEQIKIIGVGTTGSGRELIGELIGADTIKDEITAHKTGALHVSKTMMNGTVDTIFEIGGQDAKFISINNGVVVDFTMNEACAAGTGSFLEEQAERLGIKIKDEFAELALSSKKPIKLGERCTVFMERDVEAQQAKGADIKDIVAGLSYSVVLNYLNRVVRGRKIGNHIFFQGGTAYNDAVAAAFARVLEKKITVPPHNGVIGAVGAALLAQVKIESGGNEHIETKFKGFNIEKINYNIREFTCKACTNECEVQEFTVDGSKTYWGDKCSSRYRKTAHVESKPILADLFVERKQILLEGYEKSSPGTGQGRLGTIGIPRSMYFHDRFPFWNAYLSGLGFNVLISDETNRRIVEAGISTRVAEPCHPIAVAHGHVKALIDKGVDYIWLPNVLTAEPNGQTHVRPYICPWGMTLPYVVTSSPTFEAHKPKFLTPTLHHMHGTKFLSRQLYALAKSLGVSKKTHQSAFKKALSVQEDFRRKVATLGEMALHKLAETGEDAVVLIGRPYNIYDLHINLNVPTKLRNSYGVDVIPMDILPVPETDITDIADHMFWSYGKKILSTAKFIRNYKNLHMIYITNFKCGPDSFVKHFVRYACGKPFLTLQFDEHSNDAGIMTRIEAYLDSKGILKSKMKNSHTEKTGHPLAAKTKPAPSKEAFYND